MSTARVDFTRGAAERIARAVRLVEQGGRDGAPLRFRRSWETNTSTGPAIRVGRTTEPWPVGTCLPIGVYETVPSGECIPTGCVPESGGGESSGVPGSACNPDSTIGDVANLSHYVPSNSWVIVGRAANGRWYLIDSFQETFRLGTVSATWAKGATATVTKLNEDGSATTVTFTAKNWFADVTVSSGEKKVSCALVGNTWILIAAEC